MKALTNTIVLAKSSQGSSILIPDNVKSIRNYNKVVAIGPEVKIGLEIGDEIDCNWNKVYPMKIGDTEYLVTDSTNTIVVTNR